MWGLGTKWGILCKLHDWKSRKRLPFSLSFITKIESLATLKLDVAAFFFSKIVSVPDSVFASFHFSVQV